MFGMNCMINTQHKTYLQDMLAQCSEVDKPINPSAWSAECCSS